MWKETRFFRLSIVLVGDQVLGNQDVKHLLYTSFEKKEKGFQSFFLF